MRCTREQIGFFADAANHRELLVLGYEGTLMQDMDLPATAPAETENAQWTSGLSLEPWLESASLDLHRRSSVEHSGAGWERIDLCAWFNALRSRLSGILTQIILDRPDLTERKIAHQFPVLSALLNDAIAEWVDAVAVFLHRLHNDASGVATWLGYQKLPELVSLSPSSADLHDGGHTALRLIFQDRSCIYYKPRPVTGEWLWDRLVHAVNGHSSLQLPSAPVLAGKDGQYGWIMSLPPHEKLQDWNKNSAEARRYWEAAGATLCLAEHVRMTDLHMANLMATPSGPGLFDTETLGTPQTFSATPPAQKANVPFAATMHDLLDTGLLPRPTSSELPDTSGLFGKPASVPQIMIPRWSSRPDGTRRVEMAPAALLDQGNAPHPASPLEVLPLLVSGYREAATALMRCRESLVAPDSAWRSALQHHAPRIILRNTLTYGLLLSRSLQPGPLNSAPARKEALLRALREWGHPSLPPPVVRAETETLLRLHVPRFIGLAGSRTLAGKSGLPLAPRFLSCSPAEAVLRKLGAMTPDRLNEVQVPSLLAAVFGRSC